MHAGTHRTALIGFDYMHSGRGVRQRGKQQSQDSFTDYYWENKIYKKIDNIFVMIIMIIIIIIAFNHRQGKIKYPLILIPILQIQSGVWQSRSNILSSCYVLLMCP